MSDSGQRKMGVLLSYISIIANTLIQLLYTPFLIRKLGQSEYGLYSLVASIIGYLTIMDLGFGNAIIVYTSKYREKGQIEQEKKLHGMFNFVFKIIAFVAMFLGLILYLNVETIFGNTMSSKEIGKMKIMMIILSLNLFLSFYFAIYNSIIGAYEKFIFQKIVSILHSMLTPIIMIVFLLNGYKSITLCIIITITNLLSLLLNYYFCTKKLNVSVKFNGFDFALFKTILSYSIWIFLGIVVDKVNWSVDNFVLGAVSGTIAVSIYSIASTLNQLFCSLSTAISGVLLPKISKMVARNASSDELTNEFIKIGRLQYYVIFLMCSGLILFGKQFITFWAGISFEESYYVALLLIIPVCIPLIQNLGLSIMQAMNKYKFRSISTFIMSIINIIISVFFARKWGATGAALGTCIALVICNIFLINIYYYKVIKINVIKFWKEIFIQSVPFVFPVLLILIIMFYTNINSKLSFIIYGGIYTIIYCIFAYMFSANDYEKNLLNKVLSKLHLKKV